MFPVILNTDDERHDFHSFYDRFLQICEEHKNDKRALAFAFILYDFEDAHIDKVLNDGQYWRSLNAISGRLLTVFSIHYKPKKIRHRHRRSSSSGVMEMMVMVRHDDNPSVSSNELINKYFGNDMKVKYPSILFFQVQEGEVIDSILIQLDEEKIEDAFLELKNYIRKTADVLSKITEENRNNSKEIFDLIEHEVKTARNSKVLKRRFKKLTSVAELGSTIIGLGG